MQNTKIFPGVIPPNPHKCRLSTNFRTKTHISTRCLFFANLEKSSGNIYFVQQYIVGLGKRRYFIKIIRFGKINLLQMLIN